MRVASGLNHVVALTDSGKVYTFGAGRRKVLLDVDMDSAEEVRRLHSLAEVAPSTLGRIVSGRYAARARRIAPCAHAPG